MRRISTDKLKPPNTLGFTADELIELVREGLESGPSKHTLLTRKRKLAVGFKLPKLQV